MTATARYTRTAIALHWLIALLIIAAFLLGVTMSDMAPSITKLKLVNWHKWLGVTVLGLAALRLLWRLTHTAPALPAAMAGWQVLAAKLGHLGLYLLMFAVPLSGYFFSLAAGFKVVYLGLFPLPVLIDKNPALKPVLHELHEILAWGMAVLVCVHVLAALKHHVIDRDDVLKRMLPWVR